MKKYLPPDYEPESEEVCNDQDKFVPRKAPPPKEKEESADGVVAASGDVAVAQDTQDKLPAPMDTSVVAEGVAEKEVRLAIVTYTQYFLCGTLSNF